MRARRALWIVLILLSLVVYVFHNDSGTRILLWAMILIPVLAAVFALLPVKKLEIGLRLSPASDYLHGRKASIRVKNKSFFPVIQGEAQLQIENRFTGETVQETQQVSLPGKKEYETDMEMTSVCCGQIRCTLREMDLYDPFRLFCRKTKVEEQQYFTVMPSDYPMQVVVAQQTEQIRDGEQYSMLHAGNDPGETFQIREYRAGDPIRRIHWKLTEKSDRVMVRDFGLPVENEILLLLETSLPPGMTADPEVMHALMSCYCSMASELVRKEIPVSLGWFDHADGLLQIAEIQQKQELSAAIAAILSQGMRESEKTVVGAYLAEHAVCNYSHVGILSMQKEPDSAKLVNGNRVTLFLLPPHKERGQGTTVEDEVRTVMLSIEELRSGCLLAEL